MPTITTPVVEVSGVNQTVSTDVITECVVATRVGSETMDDTLPTAEDIVIAANGQNYFKVRFINLLTSGTWALANNTGVTCRFSDTNTTLMVQNGTSIDVTVVIENDSPGFEEVVLYN